MPLFASDPTKAATVAQLNYIDKLLEELNHDTGYVWDIIDFEGGALTDLTITQASEVIEALLEEKG
jgi:citrate lyase beta subunit